MVPGIAVFRSVLVEAFDAHKAAVAQALPGQFVRLWVMGRQLNVWRNG